MSNDERTAPHGGVPVLHPQFGFFGPGRKHGLVRDREWKIESHGANVAAMRLDLEQDDVGATYVVKLQVTLSDGALTIEFEATNAGDQVAVFTCGLHTYVRVDDIGIATLRGLADNRYLDALDAMTLKPAEGVELLAPINVDRVYVQASRLLQLDCGPSSLVIHQSGFGDTVVWNPGAEIAAGFVDLAGDEWRRFLCVEAAQIEPAVELAAGATWRGTQRLEVLAI